MNQSITVLKQKQQTVSVLLFIKLLFKSHIEVFWYIIGTQNFMVVTSDAVDKFAISFTKQMEFV